VPYCILISYLLIPTDKQALATVGLISD